MNALKDAIKMKRASQSGSGHEAPHHAGLMSQPQDSGGDMHSLAAGLSEDQKSQLMSILSSGGGKQTSASQIEKGAPSDTERAQIKSKMQESNGDPVVMDDDDGVSDDERDDIAMSMLDQRHKSDLDQGSKPKNLGDRVKMTMASKLKAKGKL